MDYATKALTQSLQELAADEAKIRHESANSSVKTEPATYGVCGITLPKGVDQFLQVRREFKEKTRDVSIGSY